MSGSQKDLRILDIRRHGQEIAALAAEIERLEALISEHHALGAMEAAMVGDVCPVCANFVGDQAAAKP